MTTHTSHIARVLQTGHVHARVLDMMWAMRLQSAAGAVRSKGKASGSSPDASIFLEVAREGIEPRHADFQLLMSSAALETTMCATVRSGLLSSAQSL